MKLCYRSIILILILILTGCTAETPSGQEEDSKEVTVSAAASLTDALNEIKPMFEKEYNIQVFFNFAGSGSLQQQIMQGAPVDLFISAAADKMDELVEKEFIVEESKSNLLGNSLVLIVPRNSSNGINGIEDLKNMKAGKIAIGIPETVPAGQYASQTLNNLKIWESIEDQIVFAKDVRQVLTYVETGNAEAGMVYKTDALSSDKVKIAAEADSDSHGPIIYPAGIVKSASGTKEAELFMEYLHEKQSIEIFQKYGFKVLD